MSFIFLASLIVSTAGSLTPTNLRCEYLTNPLGLEETHPRLSWVETAPGRGDKQSAYRILVASTEKKLLSGKGDLWDSGKVMSDQTTQVSYSGKPLHSRETAYWKVQVWDARARRTISAGSAYWEMGLLAKSDWKASWVGMPHALTTQLSFDGASWIWFPEMDARGEMPGGSCFVHKTLSLGSKPIDSAIFMIAADDHFKLRINGSLVGGGDGWEVVHTLDVKPFVKAGANDIVIEGINDSQKAGIAAVAKIHYSNGDDQALKTDGTWMAAKRLGDGWQAPLVIGAVGIAPWGKLNAAIENGPAPYLRKFFLTTSPVVKARVYASALGIYRLYVDGEEVSHDLLRPGWTDFHKRVQYETYDVTPWIKPGAHAVGIVLGNGWYCGRVGLSEGQNYGPQPLGLVQLELTHKDGSVERIASDASWKVGTGPITYNDLLNGESYDARKEANLAGPRFHYYFVSIHGKPAGPQVFGRTKNLWATPIYDDSKWSHPLVQPLSNIAINAQQSASVQQLQELQPQSIKENPKGSFIFDMGQNMVGYARLRVNGPRGTTVRLRFAEMLNPDKSIYVTNLRSARATDTYTLKGGATEVYEPSFTFHGFRYVEVTGFPGVPTKDAITGIVIGSNNPETGTFTTSSPLVNKLWKNIFWGQRGNYVDVPTDCPQRDERLGWMGDAQIFVRTATYNNDIAGFMTKWTRDVDDAQSNAGGFSDVTPRLTVPDEGAPAWGDAGVIVPWTIYQQYGDKRILAVHYNAMAKWIAYINDVNPNHLWIHRSSNNFGDWLNVQDDTPRDVIATAYFSYSTHILAKAAKVLGKNDDAKKYELLFRQIRQAFNDKFVHQDGTIKGDSQTDYILALRFGLLDPKFQTIATEKLAHHILVDRKGHLSTGFLGVGYLCPTLTEFGRSDIAYKLLNTDTYPSWGYSIRQGATTIWERWDGWTADKGFQDASMNSFNHYSLGSVGEWMYNTILGIDIDPEDAGFHHIVLHPIPGGGLTFAKGSVDTIHGTVSSEWHLGANGAFTLDITIPANTTATLVFPTSTNAKVTEGGQLANSAPGVQGAKAKSGHPVFELSSGTYHFKTTLAR